MNKDYEKEIEKLYTKYIIKDPIEESIPVQDTDMKEFDTFIAYDLDKQKELEKKLNFNILKDRFQRFFNNKYDTEAYEYMCCKMLTILIDITKNMKELEEIHNIIKGKPGSYIWMNRYWLSDDIEKYLSNKNVDGDIIQDVLGIIMIEKRGCLRSIYLDRVWDGDIGHLIISILKNSNEPDKEFEIVYEYLNNPIHKYIKNEFGKITQVKLGGNENE